MEDKCSLLERLNTEIYEKDIRIEELEKEIETIKNIETNKWQHHQFFKKTKLTEKLPIPRIQMNYWNDGYNCKWEYGFVFEPFWGQWEEGFDYQFIPISQTTGSGRRKFNNNIDLPFRDGKHIKVDAKNFNLPAYFVYEEENFCEEITIEEEA